MFGLSDGKIYELPMVKRATGGAQHANDFALITQKEVAVPRHLSIGLDMSRRATPQRVADEGAFPVRVILHGIQGGFATGLGPGRDPYTWMDKNIGPGEMAMYSWHTVYCPNGFALYARSFKDADRFLAAFPEFEIADGTLMEIYSSPYITRGRRR